MIGLVFLSIGVVMAIFAFHAMGSVEKRFAKEKVTSSPISPTERVPEEIAFEESEKGWYWIAAGGAILIILGGGIAICYRK